MEATHGTPNSEPRRAIIRTPLDWIAALAFIVGCLISALGAFLSTPVFGPLSTDRVGHAAQVTHLGMSAYVVVALALFGRGSGVHAVVFGVAAAAMAWQVTAITRFHSNLLWVFLVSTPILFAALWLALRRPESPTS